jgi:hypothetical protein
MKEHADNQEEVIENQQEEIRMLKLQIDNLKEEK